MRKIEHYRCYWIVKCDKKDVEMGTVSKEGFCTVDCGGSVIGCGFDSVEDAKENINARFGNNV